MRLADLTATEIADLLDLAYQQDRGADGLGLLFEQRQALADFLGCHEEIQAEAWEVWRLGHQHIQTTLRYAEVSEVTVNAELRAWRRRLSK